MKKALYLTLAALTVISCGSRKSPARNMGSTQTSQMNQEQTVVDVPVFMADSAYSYIAAQCAFGPRVPNTAAHKACAAWLESKLKSLGTETIVQEYRTKTFDGTELSCFNIIGQINPECTNRIILCSHWDSRPWADNDPDPQNHKTPIDGANDGASGVGVILELARMIQQVPVSIGIDFMFFDAEDWGPGDDWTGRHKEEYWGLGTQYWARHQHREGYRARYAILLDMVGGKGARFPMEQYSVRYGKTAVDKVWDTAARLGYGHLFPKTDGYFVTDDHLFINTIARIPAIDIVPCVPASDGTSSFGPTWHTVSDNIGNIDPAVLKIVGQTLATVIYSEK